MRNVAVVFQIPEQTQGETCIELQNYLPHFVKLFWIRRELKSSLKCDNCSERDTAHMSHTTEIYIWSFRQHKLQSGYQTINAGQVTWITNYIKNSTSNVLTTYSRVAEWGRMTSSRYRLDRRLRAPGYGGKRKGPWFFYRSTTDDQPADRQFTQQQQFIA
jgi:hypothetical protein